MSDNTLIISTEGREFYQIGKYGTANALAECLQKGYRPLYMPEIADARIAAPDREDRIWKVCFCTPSVRATGRGKPSNISHKGGTEFAVYAHVPNYFSNPENIRAVMDAGSYRTLPMPQEEFQRLLKMEDGRSVFVVGCDDFNNFQNGVFDVREIMQNPQVAIPFLGGIERTGRYLQAHLDCDDTEIAKFININGNRDFICSDQLPVGRLLLVGGCMNDPERMDQIDGLVKRDDKYQSSLSFTHHTVHKYRLPDQTEVDPCETARFAGLRIAKASISNP